MVVEKVTQPSPYALGMHDEYLAWHPQLKGLNNQTPSELELDYHLVSVTQNWNWMVSTILLFVHFFQFHDDGETTVHKLIRLIVHMKHHNRIVLSTMNSMNPSLYCS